MKGQDTVRNFIEHISEQPWSNYTASDYTIEQWHKACLVHLHTGPPTSKDQCKLPVKTPNGVVNRNGVHAAAAVLAGARGGVNASPEQKASARKSILSLYSQINEKPPTSLQQSDVSMTTEDKLLVFLEHHGVKGQRWGVRRKGRSHGSSSMPSDKKHLSNDELRKAIERMRLEQQYSELSSPKKKIGAAYAKSILETSGKTVASVLVGAATTKAVKKALG